MSAKSDLKETIPDMLKNMKFLPSSESDSLAADWLKKYNKTFCGFVNGSWLTKEDIEKEEPSAFIKNHKLCDYFTDNFLCDIYYTDDSDVLSNVTKNSDANFSSWSSLSVTKRSMFLYKIAEMITKYQSLFSIVECLSSGKHLHKTKTQDIPNLIESFKYYAGCMLHLNQESSLYPTGCVCIVAEEYNNPLLSLSWRIASLLASGHTILLLSDIKSCLSSFLLADICNKAGIPSGVLNVLPIAMDHFSEIKLSPTVSKLIFTGSPGNARKFSILCSQACLPYDVLVHRRPTVIVYEDADLPSAANGVLEAFFFNDTRCTSGGCKVMIQESVYEKFLILLKTDFNKILVGKNTSKTDISCAVTKVQTEYINKILKEQNVEVHKKSDVSCDYMYMEPQLINNLQISSVLVNQELGGPIIITIPFRTVKESLSMFNSDNKGCPVSIWSEKIAVALDVAHKIKSGTVWINSQNLISASVAYSGIYSSGNTVEGGQAAYIHHLSTASLVSDKPKKNDDHVDYPEREILDQIISSMLEDVTEYKHYIGGSFKQSDNGVIKLDNNTFIPNGSAADVNNAISSALASQPKWLALSRNERSQILLSLFQSMTKNKDALIGVLSTASDDSDKEVQCALNLLYYWATKVNVCNGETQEISGNVKIFQDKIPLGVISIICPDHNPLLSFVALIAPAIMLGNTVVAVTSKLNPAPILKLCQVIHSSGIPAGVINVISGDPFKLISCIRQHTNVDAVWFSGSKHKDIYKYSNVSQRVFDCRFIWKDFNETKSLKCIYEATFTKSIYLPVGEIFAN